MHYLLDSNTCIHAMRGRASVVARMSAVSPNDIAVSSVTCYELYTGAAKCKNPQRERSRVDLFVGALTHLGFDNVAATYAAAFRAELEARGEMIGPYDILVAGHACALGLTLITGNTREFARIPGLKFEDWGN